MAPMDRLVLAVVESHERIAVVEKFISDAMATVDDINDAIT